MFGLRDPRNSNCALIRIEKRGSTQVLGWVSNKEIVQEISSNTQEDGREEKHYSALVP